MWLMCMALAMGGLAMAQSPAPEYPLRAKRVAVYFSKKYFSFDDNYRIPLAQFIKSDAGADAPVEDIKVQTLVALGSLYAQQLKQPSLADSVYFLNEHPELAARFMDSYDADDHSLAPLGGAMDGTDYILVVSPLVLGSYKTASVYSRSNRIITEQIVVKTARMRIELFEPRGGTRVQVYETCIDERKTPVKDIYFEFHMEFSKTGQFLARLFSLSLHNMNVGKGSSCGDTQN